MANYAMAKQGTHFLDGSISISWPLGHEASEVVAVPDHRVTPRMHARIGAGRIVKTSRRATKQGPSLDARRYKVLTGPEARAVLDEPSGPVIRRVFDPRTGGQIDVEVRIPTRREMQRILADRDNPTTSAPEPQESEEATETA